MPVKTSVHVDDKVFKELREKVRGIGKMRVKVGVLESKGGGASAEGSDITMAELAAIHEYGAPRASIPERSFLRRTFQENEGREKLGKFIERTARQIVNNKLTPEEGLEQLGLWAVAQVKNRIKQHIPPPLKPATIQAKGSSTPLVDTGQLINAITSEVQK